MHLQEFLTTFLTTYPKARLIIHTHQQRDYFINVVPLLFHIDVIINHKNQFLDISAIDYENDIAINLIENENINLTKTQFNIVKNQVIPYEDQKHLIKIDTELPIQFFKFLTI